MPRTARASVRDVCHQVPPAGWPRFSPIEPRGMNPLVRPRSPFLKNLRAPQGFSLPSCRLRVLCALRGSKARRDDSILHQKLPRRGLFKTNPLIADKIHVPASQTPILVAWPSKKLHHRTRLPTAPCLAELRRGAQVNLSCPCRLVASGCAYRREHPGGFPGGLA